MNVSHKEMPSLKRRIQEMMMKLMVVLF